MKTVCLGWLRTHPAPIVLADDGARDGDGAVSIGMCKECAHEWEASASMGSARRDLLREAYIRYLKGQEPDPRD